MDLTRDGLTLGKECDLTLKELENHLKCLAEWSHVFGYLSKHYFGISALDTDILETKSCWEITCIPDGR